MKTGPMHKTFSCSFNNSLTPKTLNLLNRELHSPKFNKLTTQTTALENHVTIVPQQNDKTLFLYDLVKAVLIIQFLNLLFIKQCVLASKMHPKLCKNL